MVEIPDSLHTLFSTTVEERDGSYVVTIPRDEVERSPVAAGETYRVAVLDRTVAERETTETASTAASSGADGASGRRSPPRRARADDAGGRRDAGRPEPPVDAGEVRSVTVEAIGDKGDGIAKVERGYVVIVPGASPGEEVEVEITSVQQNVAFAEVTDGADAA